MKEVGNIFTMKNIVLTIIVTIASVAAEQRKFNPTLMLTRRRYILRMRVFQSLTFANRFTKIIKLIRIFLTIFVNRFANTRSWGLLIDKKMKYLRSYSICTLISELAKCISLKIIWNIFSGREVWFLTIQIHVAIFSWIYRYSEDIAKFYVILYFIFLAYYLSRCARNDPDINTCLKNSANRLAKFLRQGIAELGIDEVCFVWFFFRFIFQLFTLWHRRRFDYSIHNSYQVFLFYSIENLIIKDLFCIRVIKQWSWNWSSSVNRVNKKWITKI